MAQSLPTQLVSYRAEKIRRTAEISSYVEVGERSSIVRNNTAIDVAGRAGSFLDP